MTTPEVRDPDIVLSDVTAGCRVLGLPVGPDTDLAVTDALDYFTDQAAHPYRPLPPVRGAVVALLRGIAAALAEDDLGEGWRFPTRTQHRWWGRAHHATHRVTRHRFDRWDCTFCHHRVGGRGPEHAVACRQWAPR